MVVRKAAVSRNNNLTLLPWEFLRYARCEIWNATSLNEAGNNRRERGQKPRYLSQLGADRVQTTALLLLQHFEKGTSHVRNHSISRAIGYSRESHTNLHHSSFPCVVELLDRISPS